MEKFYTAGKKFTLPPAVTAWTNLTSLVVTNLTPTTQKYETINDNYQFLVISVRLEIDKLIYCVSLFPDAAHSHSKACTISFPDICSISIQRSTSQGCFVWLFVFLQLVSQQGFDLPHLYIFVCWRSIACTFTGDCLFFLFICFRTVAGTLGKVALSQMFVLHSHDEAWKEKNKVDEQDNSAQEKKWF